MPALVDIGVGALILSCAFLLTMVGMKLFKDVTKDDKK
jgi:hypothetical protein